MEILAKYKDMQEQIKVSLWDNEGAIFITVEAYEAINQTGEVLKVGDTEVLLVQGSHDSQYMFKEEKTGLLYTVGSDSKTSKEEILEVIAAILLKL